MMKDKRSESVISIRLKGLGQTHVFNPNDTISGVVEIQPNSIVKCRAVVITVGWHTEGRGDRNSMTIYEDKLPITEIYPDSPVIHHFDVTLPPEPWSYAGTLIRVVWEIHAKVDIAMAKDINEALPFVLEPTD
ncbi:MAG: hypothetical protein Q9P44_12605 [Anaerolineae bacterium]|nr:hypothetical protein [Anaerolineae bacterium]